MVEDGDDGGLSWELGLVDVDASVGRFGAEEWCSGANYRASLDDLSPPEVSAVNYPNKVNIQQERKIQERSRATQRACARTSARTSRRPRSIDIIGAKAAAEPARARATVQRASIFREEFFLKTRHNLNVMHVMRDFLNLRCF